MKKLAALLILALALSLAACGAQEAAEEENINIEEEETAEEETAEEEETAVTLPEALIGSWALDAQRSDSAYASLAAAASLEIGEDGAVRFFLPDSAQGGGEGSIVMEEGAAVAHTVSYLEGVEESFVLTPEEGPAVKMEYQGAVLYWVEQAQARQESSGSDAPYSVDPEFSQCLENISSYVEVGTARAFLSGIQQAADLMDWAVTTDMSREAVSSALSAHLSALDIQSRTLLLSQLEQVDGAYQQLLTSGQEEVLSSAGVTSCGYPWGSEPLPAVEALMSAAGLR